MKRPFAPTGHLTPDLDRVEAYWRGMLRGSAQIPFWDDFKPTDLPDLRGRLFLIGVYPKPNRFRFDLIGADVTQPGQPLEGLFADETPLVTPFEFLISQCHATLEAEAPTLYRHEPDGGRRPYARLILPMWGDGRIGMLLGAIDWI